MQHLKEKNTNLNLNSGLCQKKDRAASRPQISFTKSITRLGNGEVKVRAFVIVFSSSLVRGRAVRKRKSTNFQGLKNPKSVNYNYDMHQRSYWRGSNECIRTNKYQNNYTHVTSTADKSAGNITWDVTPASIGRSVPCRLLQRDTHTDCHAIRIGTKY